MSEADPQRIDPNSASEEELQQLPGVGPQLAGRIIKGRPYARVEDLARVSGLGESVLEEIEPLIIFGDVGRAPPDEEEIDEPEPALASDRKAAKAQKYPLAISESKPKGASIWAVIAVGAASVLCSVTLTLAILAGINGTLNFSRTAAMQETRSDLLQIQSQLEAVQVEVDVLRARAEALEGVSGRMIEVEDQVGDLQQQVDDTLLAVNALQVELTTALEETRAQAERVNRFQTFLDGLSRLVSQATTEP